MAPELKGSGRVKEHMVKWLGLLILLTVQNTALRFLGLLCWRAEALIGVTFCWKQSVPYICQYMSAVFYYTASASYPGYYLDKHIVAFATLGSVELHICVIFLSSSFSLPSCSSLSFRQPSYEHLLWQKINYLSVLRAGESIPCHYYSVLKRNKEQRLILDLQGLNTLILNPRSLEELYAVFFVAALNIFMKRVHCDMKLSLFKSWQPSVTNLVGWSRVHKVRRREAPLVVVFHSLHDSGSSCLSGYEKEVARFTSHTYAFTGANLDQFFHRAHSFKGRFRLLDLTSLVWLPCDSLGQCAYISVTQLPAAKLILKLGPSYFCLTNEVLDCMCSKLT